jgi:hypothetical protein
MNCCTTTIFVLFSICLSASGQQSNFQRMFSPKLRQFVASHPAAMHIITNAVSEAFSNRTAQLYYFYSEDASVPRASHYYPSEAAVGIMLRENQPPIDEYLCLLFEVVNSESEERFRAIYQKAQSGDISRRDFPRAILKEEFKAAIRTRDLIKQLKLDAKEVAESEECQHFLGCPTKFEDFLDYSQKISSPERDAIKEYEAVYDSLRNSH